MKLYQLLLTTSLCAVTALPAFAQARPFSDVDADGDGQLSRGELEAVFGPRGARGILGESDLNGDGLVSISEIQISQDDESDDDYDDESDDNDDEDSDENDDDEDEDGDDDDEDSDENEDGDNDESDSNDSDESDSEGDSESDDGGDESDSESDDGGDESDSDSEGDD